MRLVRRLGALALGLLAALGPGCADDLTPVVGTAIRVGTPKVEPGTELSLKIFTNEGDCLNAVKPSDVPQCLPHVDRASGEVRLGIQFKLDTDVYYMPMGAENLRVIHQGTEVQDGQNGQRYTVIPHEPKATPQLFILVIDGSSSMNGPTPACKTPRRSAGGPWTDSPTPIPARFGPDWSAATIVPACWS